MENFCISFAVFYYWGFSRGFSLPWMTEDLNHDLFISNFKFSQMERKNIYRSTWMNLLTKLHVWAFLVD